ncbi:MAG: hypothetical protein VYB65_10815 [Myxococcota bacterium]|nr:hypothetical protein [Myxococcota bacterium]
MTTFRVLAIASFVTLFGCTSEDDTVDQQAQCQANCIAAGHTSGTFANELCSCETAPTPDAGNTTPTPDTGATPGTDAGTVSPPTDAGGAGPRAEAGNPNTGDAGYNNHDIGVIDPDAGSMVLTREMRCSELCQWGFNGWQFGADGGPGQPIECPQDRQAVFGAEELQACTTACTTQTAAMDVHVFRLMKECIETRDCGDRAACAPATISQQWPAPICEDLCTGIIDYRTPASQCQPPRFGEDCPAGCAAQLREAGALHGQAVQRCYSNLVTSCAGEGDQTAINACQCRRQANCHDRDDRLAQRLAWQYCSLRNEHCRPPEELPMNMVDCIDMRMIEVLGHRNLPELQACLRAFEEEPNNCFENLDGCLTPF